MKLFNKISCILMVFALSSARLGKTPRTEFTDTGGPWSLLDAKGYAGTVVMNNLTGSNLFYWLFIADNGDIDSDSKPLILWLQGGPGCSGESAMLFENICPIKINNETLPETNPYAWTSLGHVLTVDFPYGAGYSRAKSSRDIKNTTLEATEYLYNFLVKLATSHSSWFNRDMYIFGESYAGHWIPGIAYRILTENAKTSTTLKLPLKGVGMGDPLVDPAIQSQYYAKFAYNTGLIDSKQEEIVESLQAATISNLNSKNYLQASDNFEASFEIITNYAGGINVYNIRENQPSYDLGQFPKWLNLQTTRDMLHVPQDVYWVECDDSVYNTYKQDAMNSTIQYLPYIISNIRVLFYNGQDDLILNTPSAEALIAGIDWDYIGEFFDSKRSVWKVNGEVAGYGNRYLNLNFVVMLKAGHLVPHDQPVNARNMVYRFINDIGWN